MILKRLISILAVGLPLTLMCCKEWQIKRYGDRIVGDWGSDACFTCVTMSTHVFTEDGKFMTYVSYPGENYSCDKDTLIRGPYHYRIDEDKVIIDNGDVLVITKLTQSDLIYKQNGYEAKFHRCK